MARELKGWQEVNMVKDLFEDQKDTLAKALIDCKYKPNDRFLNNCVARANKNKRKIIDKIGGVELYTIMEMDAEKKDEETLLKFSKALGKMQQSAWGDMADKHYTYDQVEKCFADFETVLCVPSPMSESNKIDRLKARFSDLEFVSRLRDKLPKETKVLSNILTYIVKKHNLDSSLEKQIPLIIDTIGSNKKKQYILVLSTVPSAIYTASVSEYFESCYDIRGGGHCYASSVSYLALDSNTAVLKVFEYNEENVKLLETGGVGALSSSRKALARRFVFFKDSADNKETISILGKAYPNENIIEGSFLSKEMYKLYTKDYKSDLDSYSLGSHEYYSKVKYSGWFTGYKDLREKGGVIAHKSEFSEDNIVEMFNDLRLAYNGICTIDTGDYIAYSFQASNIGRFPYGREDDYDYDDEDDWEDDPF